MEKLKISELPVTSGDICKKCVHAILMGNPKHGTGFYARYCGCPSNLVEEENYTEGIITIYAELCSEHNPSGLCGDYDDGS